MKHSLGWVKGKVRLKILGFLLHLESAMWWRRRKGQRGGGEHQFAAIPVASDDSLKSQEKTGSLHACTWFTVSGDKTNRWTSTAHRAGSVAERVVTVRWSGTRPDWCWQVSRWWWPAGRSSPPLDWRSWSVPLTSDESHWSWHLDGQWCSQSTVRNNIIATLNKRSIWTHCKMSFIPVTLHCQ